ncbi:MAG: N-6 DNA methylase [Candidatus Kapabacteria bacterium]|nr:N-6 DNA methylase [Candidatus Kapabacteria bacterium]
MENKLIKLRELVERFENNLSDYKSPKYDEENTKIDYIDRFFELLDWDVYNKQGYSEDFRDVVREDKVYYKGQVISPDYGFKIGKERQFFVEAKKPSVNIFEGISEAYQIRRYAYSVNIPISILTDFEEFAVYDTREKPNPTDKAGTSRIFYCTYKEYEKYWNFIYDTFAKPSVLKGNLKKYIDDNQQKKGTMPIDKAMLNMIDGWREDLAKNIALRNKSLDIFQMNEAVQKIIDRIVFLRIAEDRRTEMERSLEILSEKPDIFFNLVKYFSSANKKYNSELFKEIDWINSLAIDDKIFKKIIKDIYYPSPYEFSVLPIEILGQIYEQFLGKTIRLTTNHQAKIEEKPEVRKAGGVYYTPQYIVDFIIENTLGELIKNKEPKEIENITILDPACGSGSFLVRAFDYLLNYHLNFYSNEENRAKAIKDGKIFQDSLDSYKLTIREKKRILLSNIYGVDIDFQAVEVTKLSLLLKLMEGEIVESRNELFLKSQTEALLPDLSSNIKCGNSLVGSDFYDDKDLSLFDMTEIRQINSFDWEKEFPHIFKGKVDYFDKEYFEKKLKQGLKKAKQAFEYSEEAYKDTSEAYEYAKKFNLVEEPEMTYVSKGGFDVVIGNPPYVSVKVIPEKMKKYFINNYKAANGQFDLYQLFLEKATQLLSGHGTCGMITSNTYLNNKDAYKLREYLLQNTNISHIINFGEGVFSQAKLDVAIIIFDNFSRNLQIKITKNEKEFLKHKFSFVDKNVFVNTNDLNFNINLSNRELQIINKMYQKSTLIRDILNLPRGIEIGSNSNLIERTPKKNYDKLLVGKSIKRYQINFDNLYIKFDQNDKSKFKDLSIYKQDKILIQRIRNLTLKRRIIATIDKEGYLCTNTLRIGLKRMNYINLEIILGILNSKLINWLFLKKFFNKDIYAYQLEQIPIPNKIVDKVFEKSTDFSKLVSLVTQMLELNANIISEKIISETDKKFIKQKIELLDKQIDNFVYKIYDLTDDEIKIIEEEYL